jgi:hypothetical protein
MGRWLCVPFHLLQPGFIAAAENEFGNKIGSPASGFAQQDAEVNKIFGIHNLI